MPSPSHKLDEEYKQAHYTYDVEMASKLAACLTQILQWVMFSGYTVVLYLVQSDVLVELHETTNGLCCGFKGANVIGSRNK